MHACRKDTVLATAAAIARLDPGIAVETVQDRYSSRIPIGQAVFCCVDSITARAAVWRSAGPKCRF
jgi:sulfur carrier protein ThiS adenylyltransferase